jgi:hypothetical protein
MGMIVGSVNSYDDPYPERSSVSQRTQSPGGEVGASGPTGNDKPRRTDGSVKDARNKADRPQSSPAQNRQAAKEATEVANLKKRDTEVRAHEQAHISAGGQYVRGGASYEYTTGPDGRKYAVSGEVSIDTSPVPDDPQRTIQKMLVVRRAALAPSEPSPQDRQIASVADRVISQSRIELMRKASEKSEYPATKAHLKKGTHVNTVV